MIFKADLLHLKTCNFLHSTIICEDFLENGICKSNKLCFKRHPKNCRYWCKSAEGCKRGEMCEFLHLDSKRFKDNLNKINITNELVNIDSTNDVPILSEVYNDNINNENTKSFFCDQCDFTTCLEYLINEHKTLSHEELQFTCNECDFTAKTKGGLTRHKNSKHKSNECNTIDKTTSNIQDEAEGHYSCNECCYKTQITYDYMSHAEYAHSIEQSMMCDEYNFQTKNDKEFISHLTLLHHKKIIAPWD